VEDSQVKALGRNNLKLAEQRFYNVVFDLEMYGRATIVIS
jgi:hypothetical protein